MWLKIYALELSGLVLGLSHKELVVETVPSLLYDGCIAKHACELIQQISCRKAGATPGQRS